MLKALGITAALTLLPKVLDKASEGIDELWDVAFGDEPIVVTDMLTKQIALFIRYHHQVTSGTPQEHVIYYNNKFNWDKSYATYACIWKADFDVNTLPEGAKVNE